MNITVSTNNNKTIVNLPFVPTDGLTIDYGSSTNENVDSVKYGQIKKLGREPLATVSIDSFFPAVRMSYDRGSFEDPYKYIQFFRNNRKKRKPVRLVITDKKDREIFNRLMAIETFSWTPDKVGGFNYSLSLEQYRKVK
nr:MAG TPA: tail assembly protein [Caudoviricetes sp.]